MSEQTNKRKKASQPAKLIEKEIRLAATRGEVGWEGELKKGGKKYTHTPIFHFGEKKSCQSVLERDLFQTFFKAYLP